MKTSTILVNCLLLATGLAAPGASLARRDLAAIQGALKKVEDGLGKVKTAVGGLKADDINSGTPILSASDALSKTIKQATTDIQGSQELSLQDALSLQQSSSGLITAAQDTISALTAKKPALDQLGVTQVAVTTLKQQKTDSAALGKALVSKIPAIGQGIAQQSVDQIGTTLDQGITALSAAPAAGAAPAAPAGGANGGNAGGKGNGTAGAAPKPSEPKPAEPAEPVAAEPKPAEPKPAEPKPAEPKPAEPKPAEPAAPEPAAPKPEPATPKPEPAAPKPEPAAPAEPAQPKPAAGNNNNNDPLGAILGLLGQGNNGNKQGGANANANPVTALLGAAGGANGNNGAKNAGANPLAALVGRADQAQPQQGNNPLGQILGGVGNAAGQVNTDAAKAINGVLGKGKGKGKGANNPNNAGAAARRAAGVV